MRYMKSFVVAALIAVLPVGAHASSACGPGASESRIVPLLELYTAEGCSSCPPADRLISKWKDRNDVNVLSFHVDYWDAIGWPDRFANAAFRQRHEARAANSGKNVLYTPQIMVGTETMLDWRFPARVDAILEARANSAPSLHMSMQVAEEGKGLDVIVRAGPTASSDPAEGQGTLLWLALYENGLQTTRTRACSRSRFPCPDAAYCFALPSRADGMPTRIA